MITEGRAKGWLMSCHLLTRAIQTGQMEMISFFCRRTPGLSDATHPRWWAARIADKALALGLAVRPTVAAELGVSKTTVDRLLKRAKAEGWFDDEPLPKRPQPPQRDTTTDEEN